MDAVNDDRVPVTVLSGFLGSGKTTLLNRILTEQHGKRIAVIENEFGEIGIDNELVMHSDEEIFEMNNGCICCTVRGDLIRILGRLMTRRDRFDHIMIETTGLADPGPVAQTFFMDDEIRENLRLDAIVTVVDAKHVAQHIGASRECQEQIAFADVILLNKTDLVAAGALDDLDEAIRGMNAVARIHRTQHAEIDIGCVLGVRAFELRSKLDVDPDFLKEELPFEWAGSYELSAGNHELHCAPGPDPELDVVVLELADASPAAFEAAKKQGVLDFSGMPVRIEPGGALMVGGQRNRLVIAETGGRFALNVPRTGRHVLFTQHLPVELDMKLRHNGAPLAPEEAREYAAPHEHDSSISSVGIGTPGSLDADRFESWMMALLRIKGVDIFRMKGVLSLAGKEERFVFQGVHMLFDGVEDRPWDGEERYNQLVFIGRNLDRDELEQGFRACLV